MNNCKVKKLCILYKKAVCFFTYIGLDFLKRILYTCVKERVNTISSV